MSTESTPAYGESSAWRPERPNLRLFPILTSWLATGIAFMVAAGIVPGAASTASGAPCSSRPSSPR